MITLHLKNEFSPIIPWLEIMHELVTDPISLIDCCPWGANWYVNGDRQSAIRKTSERELPEHGDPRHPFVRFCKCMPCFQVAENTYFKMERVPLRTIHPKICFLIQQTQANRRWEPITIISSEGQLYFNGNRVCNKFLSTTFQFSNYMQVKSARPCRAKSQIMKTSKITDLELSRKLLDNMDKEKSLLYCTWRG